MATQHLTLAPAAVPVLRPFEALVLRGRLPAPHESIRLCVECDACADGLLVHVTYRGAPETLIAAGCAREAMFDSRAFRRALDSSEVTIGVADGAWWHTRRLSRGRALVLYRFEPEASVPDGDAAWRMPGVQELLPAGLPRCDRDRALPAPSGSWEELEEGSAAAWKAAIGGFCSSMVDAAVRGVSGLTAAKRFRVSDVDAARIAAIGARFRGELLEAVAAARVIDARRGGLRLIRGTADGELAD